MKIIILFLFLIFLSVSSFAFVKYDGSAGSGGAGRCAYIYYSDVNSTGNNCIRTVTPSKTLDTNTYCISKDNSIFKNQSYVYNDSNDSCTLPDNNAVSLGLRSEDYNYLMAFTGAMIGFIFLLGLTISVVGGFND